MTEGQRLAAEAATASEVRNWQTHPDVVALRIERIRAGGQKSGCPAARGAGHHYPGRSSRPRRGASTGEHAMSRPQREVKESDQPGGEMLPFPGASHPSDTPQVIEAVACAAVALSPDDWSAISAIGTGAADQ